MRILCTTSSFTAKFPDEFEVIMNPFGRRLSESEVAELLALHRPIGMVAGVEPLSRAVLSAADGLKVISRCGTGLDNVDLEAARELGIVVRNTPLAPVASVAELTVGLMLCALRKVPVADASVRRGEWPRLKGGLLRGRRVGIVGCGRIGTAVASLLSAFGCELVGFDPLITEHTTLRMVTLAELLCWSDIVSLHAPLNDSTRHVIDADALSRMKPGSVLVNTARGGLVDEAALEEALREGRVSAAALDVFEEEPYRGALVEMPERTVLTCHVASSAIEARRQMETEAVENLQTALKEVIGRQ